MKLKIKVTQEVLEATKYCNRVPEGKRMKWKLPNSLNSEPQQNCAISYACQEIFPQCNVRLGIKARQVIISNHTREKAGIDKELWAIPLPDEAYAFIRRFDELSIEDRLRMSPFEMEIDVPERVIQLIGINDLEEVLKNSTTLELVDESLPG